MRLGRLSILVLPLVVAACGPPNDPTPNRAPPSSSDYPPPPYGYAQGTTLANLNFIGKQSPSPTDYSLLPTQPITMADVRKDAKLILIDGAARWCGPCNHDQPAMVNIEASYAPRGVVTMEVVVEGSYGVAATNDDISRWAQQHALSGIITIDPSYELAKYADVTAFPLYIVVRAETMRIEYLQVGALAGSPIEPVLDSLLAQ
jgi:thiol-disulfide isomerase/thioredoxin